MKQFLIGKTIFPFCLTTQFLSKTINRLNESVEECLEKSPNIDKELDRLADILIKENIVWSKEEEFKTLIEKMDEVAIDVLMKSSGLYIYLKFKYFNNLGFSSSPSIL